MQSEVAVSNPTMNKRLEEPKKILLIEDDEDILGLIRSVLEMEGYNVVCARNGDEALRFLRNDDDLPSVILLDLMMPVMDGVEFRREQTRNPKLADVPVVVMSAASQIKEKSREIGIAAFLKKPFSIDDIISTVRSFC